MLRTMAKTLHFSYAAVLHYVPGKALYIVLNTEGRISYSDRDFLYKG